MILKITLIILVGIGFTFSGFAQEHIQWRGDNRNGIYPGEGLLKTWPDEGPELFWYYEGLGDGHGSVAVTSDKIYVTGTIEGTGYVYAFDHKGTLLWKSEIGKSWTDNWNGVRTTPMIHKGNLYIMSAFGKLVCMDPENGAKKWSIDLLEKYTGRNIRWGITENLLLDDGKLYVTLGGEKNNVIALDPANGSMVWSCPGNGEISAYHSPAVFNHGGRKILVTQTEKSILGIDAVTGKFLWSHEHINEWAVHPNTALYQEGFIYVVSGYGKGGVQLELSADGSSVTKVWENSSLDNQMGGAVLLGGRLYGGGHNNRKFFCIDWKTGKEMYNTSALQRGNTISAGGMLFFYDERGKVALVQPGQDSFNITGSFQVPYGANQHWAHLVIHDKRLYVRHGNALMVYNIAE
jgi:outer membrane protein assembly factor BamB